MQVAYMSAEKFMYRFIAALRSQSTMEFKESLRSVDVLLIDDLQFLIGKDNTQEEFFHTFNALVDAGKQIVVSSDKPPSDLAGIEDRLRTRLGCGMVADLHADHLRAPHLDPAGEGAARTSGAAEGDGVPRPQDHHQRPRARGRAEPPDRACQPVRPAR
jgi:chromosomal replication initiator protein